MTFEEMLSHFSGTRKPNGKGGFMVPCPAHGDTNPSLSISPGNGSGPIFHCFGGCTDKEAILTAAGLTWQDVLPERERENTRKPTVVSALRAAKAITRYDIRNTRGDTVAVHVREDLGDGRKAMPWQLPDGTPGLGGLKTADLPLYGIEQLTNAPEGSPVTVCEGEKATDALRANGKLAVGTVTGAAGTPGDDALRPLLGHTAFLWADNDDPGRGHMARIGAALLQLGHHDIRRIEWKGATEKGDAADLFALEGAADEYDALIDEAKPITLEAKPEAVDNKPAPLFVPVAQLLENPRKPNWFVRGYIESPSTVRIFGPSGSGKSFVSVDLATACVTNGRWMDKRVEGGACFYIAGEGHVGLARRFRAWQLHHGVARLPDNLYLSTARIELNTVGAQEVMEEVERICEESGDAPALIVIDTLARAMPAGKDENSTKDMGEFVNEVDRIRDKFQCVAVIIHHTGNTETHRARGASSMLAAVDAEMSVSMQGVIRVANWVKLKDQPLDATGHEFALIREIIGEDESAEEDEERIITSCVAKWQGRTTTKAANTITKAERLGLDTLAATIADGDSTTLGSWRTAFYVKHWGDNEEAKKKAFGRVRASLAGKDMVKIDGDRYSVPTRQGVRT